MRNSHLPNKKCIANIMPVESGWWRNLSSTSTNYNRR
jgi:hypothetical protein